MYKCPRANVIVADPAWKFGDTLPGEKRGAAKHYDVMTTADLMRFPLPDMEPNCVLFMWRVTAMQQEALDVIKAWGFKPPQREIVWRKMLRKAPEKEAFGMGHVVRNMHEVCLIAMRGKTRRPKSRTVRSMFSAPIGRHSEKPRAFFKLVEALYDGPYVELFAREHQPGWHCFGNEIDGVEPPDPRTIDAFTGHALIDSTEYPMGTRFLPATEGEIAA